MHPDDLHWLPAYQHQEGVPRMLAFGTGGVARMEQRVDNGAWYIYLDYHLQSIDRPLRRRDCTSFEAGKAGAEMWAIRHEVRLRAELAAIEAAMPRHLGAG